MVPVLKWCPGRLSTTLPRFVVIFSLSIKVWCPDCHPGTFSPKVNAGILDTGMLADQLARSRAMQSSHKMQAQRCWRVPWIKKKKFSKDVNVQSLNRMHDTLYSSAKNLTSSLCQRDDLKLSLRKSTLKSLRRGFDFWQTRDAKWIHLVG
jgi:hypothetical protein